MRIVTARRISQVFFFALFLWFCIAATLGEQMWQLRGWPVNWLIQLDPLVGLGTLLSTGSLYAGLLWGLLTVILTIVLGRFFCGWLCPFGALHQAVGWLANRKRKASDMMVANRYRRGQGIKYAVLLFLLGAAAGDLIGWLLRIPVASPAAAIAAVVLFMLAGTLIHHLKTISGIRWVVGVSGVAAAWLLLSLFTDGSRWLAASLQTGLLDPIPLFYRSVNLTLLPLVDGRLISVAP
ncbi:MAG: 4Fe-4S binding protein, partial [Desulfosarcina sp.]